ncbi:MAG: zinc ribbon domain-containing protein [Nitrospiraceae bacterium]
MPLYEYQAAHCQRQPACSGRKEYLQSIKEPALTACRECGVAMERIMSSFAARSGAVDVSGPAPTGLNLSGIPAPATMPRPEGHACSGHDHE